MVSRPTTRSRRWFRRAPAYSLYSNPGLLQGLTQWDGSTTPGSERAGVSPTGSTGAPIDYSFDPFDQSTWDVNAPASATGNNTGAPQTTGTLTGTGVVVPPPTYAFNPFDQSTWDPASRVGSNVDTVA